MKGKAFLIALCLLIGCGPVWADNNDLYSGWSGAFSQFADPNTGLTIFPTLLIPMGGRYEGMGTAYTAMALDSGFIESNPSASSLLSQTELAFYHHNWIADSNLEGVVYTVRFNDLGIGFGGKFLYVPFTAYNDWGERGAKGYITESIATMNISYNFFHSYYFFGLAAGTNLKVAYRSIPAVFSANQSSLAFMTDLGLMTSFNIPFLKFYHSLDGNFRLGATLKNLGLSSLAGEQLPLMATAGLAYSPLRPWTLACDFNYPFSFDPVNAPAEKWNVAVGTNVNVTSFLSIQSGILLKADNPRLALGTTLEFGTMSIVVNYNLDLSGELNPVDKFSVQAQFDLGDFGRKATQDQADELYRTGVKEYAQGHYEKAIECWKQVLALDPKYTPARESIDMVQQAIDLQREMESRGSQ
jgi:tetratricopeptide (TPR) repeat protein